MITSQITGIDGTKILMRQELSSVLTDLHRKASRSANTRMNLVIFRLAVCCGLRVSEVGSLRLCDIRLGQSRPHIRIRRGAAKGGKPRTVPLWWDAGTLADLTMWKEQRLAEGAKETDALITSRRHGGALSRYTLRKRFLTACKCLGESRMSTLTIHHGRHTFISHALAGGRSLAEVRDAAGHANVSITSGYLHVVIEEEEEAGTLFA